METGIQRCVNQTGAAGTDVSSDTAGDQGCDLDEDPGLYSVNDFDIGGFPESSVAIVRCEASEKIGTPLSDAEQQLENYLKKAYLPCTQNCCICERYPKCDNHHRKRSRL